VTDALEEVGSILLEAEESKKMKIFGIRKLKRTNVCVKSQKYLGEENSDIGTYFVKIFQKI
jgi:hypothetical protein